MERLLRRMDASWLGRVLRSRHYTPTVLTALLLLLVISAAQLLARAGVFSLSLGGAHPDISITSPAAPGDTDAIQVYILGAVVTPGVYRLPPDARVHDLIAAAGGATRDADPARIDLSATLRDGQSIYVPHTGEAIPILVGGKVALNAASEQDLRRSLGISLDIARRIVAYRAAHGPFTAVSQLLLVPISRATYDKIRDLVTV